MKLKENKNRKLSSTCQRIKKNYKIRTWHIIISAIAQIRSANMRTENNSQQHCYNCKNIEENAWELSKSLLKPPYDERMSE